MRKFNPKFIILILFFGMIISCNQNQNNGEVANNENSGDEEIVSINEGDSASDIENLEDKMDQIMNESKDYDGEAHRDVTIIKASGAKKVKVDIKIGAVQLKLSSGSSEFFTGGFKYTDEDWKPDVNYKVKGENGYLSLKQPKSDDYSINNNDKYAWNLKFSEKIPLEFNIELGAGLSEIFLDNLQVESFTMNMGVGKTEIDMGNSWKKDAEIHLSGGIGLSVIHLPDDVGVKMNVQKGIGSLEVRNMKKTGSHEYVNDAYSKSPVTLRVYLNTGIGQIVID